MNQLAASSGRLTLCLSLVLLAGPIAAADPPSVEATLLTGLKPRPLGPANMSGRVVALAVVESRPATMYVASASGGLWKTVNNGITWTPVFDHQETVALGHVAVAPSQPETVWVGTGEANARNSVSWGDGVYKSTDGGTTWQNMGLAETRHISRIVIHPHDPDTVYVAALGHIWGPNKERGIFKTVDGGKSWEPVHFISENTGCTDLVMDPADPDTLYAAGYRVRRDAFSGANPAVQFASESGLYKTTDAGKTWSRLAKGLPTRPLGRCGLSVSRKDPNIVYALVSTDRTDIRTIPGQPAKTSDLVETGGVFRSADKGKTWTKLNDLCPRPFYFGQIRVDPNDDQRIYVLGVAFHVSRDGGKTFRTGAATVHADHHALWIDPHDADHLVVGCDGGLYFSYDRGLRWEHLRNLPITQFYAASIDLRKPYRVYGGLQDNGTWGGPSATRNPDGITVADWFRVLGADGFHCQVDPTDPDTVYAEAQYGRLHRINVRTGDDTGIRPEPPPNAPAYRFNWSSPILLSPHRASTVYYGGNHLFRSKNRGNTWEVISPDLTHGKPGPSLNTGHTITTIAESPLKAGLLYVGTDDGRVHVSHTAGGIWNDVSDRIPDVPAERWINRVECSHFAEGTAYLAIDRHRHEDRRPYLFKTTDHGLTWKPLAGNLPPDGPIHVIREDLRNRDLLFVGTEFGLFVSLDGGAAWQRLRSGLPTVAVHDLIIHPRDRDLVIATHGRGMFVLDIAPLQELTPTVLASPAHLFDVKPATAFEYHGTHGLGGGKVYAAPNPPFGAAISYYLKDRSAHPARLLITDASGTKLAELAGTEVAGLHQVTWNLRGPARAAAVQPGGLVRPGAYAARLEVDGRVLTKPFRVEAEE